MPYQSELDRLAALGRQFVQTRADIEASVQKAREAGAPWSEIGEALGMSKQGAHRRFGGSIS